MAISAYSSITTVAKTVFGNKRVLIGYISFANDTWPSGGVSLTPANIGMEGVDMIFFIPGSIQYYWIPSTEMMNGVLCGTAGAAQAQVGANGATIASGEKVYFIAVGYGKG